MTDEYQEDTTKLLGGIITWQGIAIALVAGFFWTLPTVLPVWFPHLKTYTELWWWLTLEGIIRLLSGAIVAGILVDGFLNSRRTMEYVERRLRSAIVGEEYVNSIISRFASFNISQLPFLKSLTKPVLRKAHANIVRVANDIEFPEDGMFYKTLTDKLEPLLGAPHIELLDVVINNNVELVNGVLVIKSDRTTTIDFHTRNDAKVDVGFARQVQRIAGIPDADLYDLRVFKVGPATVPVSWSPVLSAAGTHLTIEIQHIETLSANSTMRVVLKETVILPPSDVIYWRVRDDRSLRRLKVNCSFNEDVFPRLFVYGFPSDSSDKEAIEDKRSCSIDWNGWMVPHHNFMITWDDPLPRGASAAHSSTAAAPMSKAQALPTHKN